MVTVNSIIPLQATSISFSPSSNPLSFPLHNAFLCAEDGLIQHQEKLYYHFQRYDWDLAHPERNPKHGEHKRRVERRLEAGALNIESAKFLSGHYLLGISPFIDSYYHFICDLLPYLLHAPSWPILIPNHLPANFVTFLQQAGFHTIALTPQIYQVEHLLIPQLTNPDWTSEKVQGLRNFRAQLQPQSTASPYRKLYLSRKRAKKRHFVNEDELLPYLHHYGFQRIFLENLPLLEQFKIFQEAKHIISPHGAGLVNLIFSSKTAHILEVRPNLSSGQFCFEQLCSHGWLNYEYLVPLKRAKFHLDRSLLLQVLERWFP